MQTTTEGIDAERIPFWSALVRDRRIAPALGLGFTSGMPFLLTYSTQSAWLTDAGVPLATIGLLNELTLAYKFKFLWAPFLDQYDPPLLGRALGRRRGWLIVAILAVMAMLAGIAFGDPGQHGHDGENGHEQPAAPPPEHRSDQRRIILIEKWRPNELELIGKGKFA